MRWITAFLLLLINSVVYANCAILIHGLGRSDHSMQRIEKALIKQDYIVINTAYSAKGKSIETLANEIIPQAITQCESHQDIYFVTHSLGGILLRQHLSLNPLPNLKRVVMLGPPNQGSEVADTLNQSLLHSFLEGETILQLGTDLQSKPKTLNGINAELGIIAGNRSINWILSRVVPGNDDGKVSVENTKLEGMHDHLTLPVTHTFMMINHRVIEQTIAFLGNGKFNR